jgi:hypothetical protein
MMPSFWKTSLWIACEECRAMWRNRVTLAALVLGLLLAATATLVGFEHRHSVDAERARYQTLADSQW